MNMLFIVSTKIKYVIYFINEDRILYLFYQQKQDILFILLIKVRYLIDKMMHIIKIIYKIVFLTLLRMFFFQKRIVQIV